MTDLCRKIKICKKDRLKALLTKELLQKLSQEELIDKVMQLQARNEQLSSILKKKISEDSPSLIKGKVKTRKEIDFEKAPKRHVLLKFFYLGWNHEGFVVQENTKNTVEGLLMSALQKCCLIENKESSNYHRCGRTDKGVSAFSQVVSIDLRSKLPEPNEENVDAEFPYCTMLNRVLPNTIKCYGWSHVSSNVSARFDCFSRTYKYYFPRGNLNIEAMQEGAKFLVGKHDFRNFCKMDVGNGVTIFEREILFVKICQSSSSISTSQMSDYQLFELIITGRSFLWHQIRCIVSVLFLIGQGKESPDIVKQLLNVEENPRKPQYTLANHFPLNLYDVNYQGIPLKWNVEEDDLSKTIEFLQSQWTEYYIRSSMIKNMIDDLEKFRKNPKNIQKQVECLQDGVRSRVYKPLLSRMKCDSLEDKIDHFIKRKKIEVVETENKI